jgi:hypothetical protein
MSRTAKVLASETTDAIVLSPTEGTKLIVGLYNADAFERTLLFRGPPGVGKTTMVRAAAQELGINYIEVNPTMPADEVGGIPDLIRKKGETTKTDYAMPVWFPMDPEYKGILCLDDALQGDKLMQQTLANLIQARNLRGHPLPKGVMIVATGNRVEDNAGVTRMLSHLADRLTPINIEPNTMSWINDYAIPNGVDSRIVSFIQQHQDALNQFDPKLAKCPTSRTWAALSTRMSYIDTLNTPATQDIYQKFAQAIITGELGMGMGVKFWAYCQIQDKIPCIDDILKNPKDATVDLEPDLQYATAVAVAKRMDEGTFGNALEYVERLGGTDLTAMVVKLGCREKPVLKRSEAFNKWALSSQELIHGVG